MDNRRLEKEAGSGSEQSEILNSWFWDSFVLYCMMVIHSPLCLSQPYDLCSLCWDPWAVTTLFWLDVRAAPSTERSVSSGRILSCFYNTNKIITYRQRLSNQWRCKPAWRAGEGQHAQMAHPLAGDEETLVLLQALPLVGLTLAPWANPFTSFGSFQLQNNLLGAFLFLPDLKKAPPKPGCWVPHPCMTPSWLWDTREGQHTSHQPRGASGTESPSPPSPRCHKMTKHQIGFRFANYNFRCSWAEPRRFDKWVSGWCYSTGHLLGKKAFPPCGFF